MKKIRVGFFGLAHPHLSIIRKSISDRRDDFEIVGFADIEPFDGYFHDELTQSLRDRHGIKEYADWKELVAQGLDLAVVTTDNALRGEICTALLSAGINVIDEKPMAPTFDEAKKNVSCRQGKRSKDARQLANCVVSTFQTCEKARGRGQDRKGNESYISQSGDLGRIFVL